MTRISQTARCPICDRPSAGPTRPFCSPRCADIDLGHWLKGDYVVPGPPADPMQPGIEGGAHNRSGRVDPEEGLG